MDAYEHAIDDDAERRDKRIAALGASQLGEINRIAFESANYLLAQAEAERDQLRDEVARLTAEREAVCQWKKVKATIDADYAIAGCVSFTLYVNDAEDFTYCPYCGRKIKIVEREI